MEGWTRDQAIADVMLASDGFGRACGPDLETPPNLEDFQPCVVEIARHIVHLRQRIASGALLPRDLVGMRCARPGCSQLFNYKPRKRFCSMTCAIREQRRLRAARLRRRG